MHVLALAGVLLASTLVQADQGFTGSPWPMPQKYTPSSKVLEIQPNQFFFEADSAECDILEKALIRYKKLIFLQDDVAKPSGRPLLTTLTVNVANLSECGFPQHGMDEEYSLSVDEANAVLSSNTVWGALRGLETFSQLVYIDEQANNYFINATDIEDFPRFSFRSVMLDSARHFLSVKKIKQNIDAMAFNKFNVFHWHIVDDESWPLQLKTYPNVTGAAWHPKLVFTQEDVKDILEYARERGIRVLPEIDTPGHSRAIGRMLPEIMTGCTVGRATINPARDFTYEVVQNIIKEVHELFPDNYFHLGMDEVDYKCWESSEEITQFMQKMNLTTYPELEQYYVKRTLDNVRKLGAQYIIWQDPINNGVVAAPDTIVGVWLDTYDQIQNVTTKHGYQIVLSAPWYLNYISYGSDWEKYYSVEPTLVPSVEPEKDLIIGGEACMWAELVDGTNVFPRLWPRACAVAERLWSNMDVTDVDAARARIGEQRCRMLRRGYPAQPYQASYCGPYEWED